MDKQTMVIPCNVVLLNTKKGERESYQATHTHSKETLNAY